MADPIEVPIPTDAPLYTLRVTLDGAEWLILVDWDGREGRWYLSLGTVDGAWVVRGVKVVADWPLLRHVRGGGGPPGNLYAADFSNRGEPPGYSDFGPGRRVRLLYQPVDSV